MPSGKTHIRIDLFMLVIVMGVVVYFWGTLAKYLGRDEVFEYWVVFVVAYLFGTFLLSPDMDLHTSDPMKNWGVLRLLWRPYSAVFKHRGLSHMPIVGTLTRVVYILLVVYCLLVLANMSFDLGWKISGRDLKEIDRNTVVWGLCGLCLPDIFHIVADRCFKNRR